ncbi:MAG: response regulator transcription factor [Clostridia bacterium]|nr:response regulator transcription factor [Clostridia bacterium]
MLKFCIIDDNQKVLNKLESILESIFIKNDFDAEITFKTTNAQDLLAYASNNKMDVFLIDIELHSNISGLKIAEKIRDKNKDCYFIFTTAHLEYGFMAYKYKTFDYLSKPITSERLEETITRLFDDINGDEKKFIRLDNKNTIIDEKEIKYIKRDGMKIIFHTEARDYEVYSSFNKLQDKLPDNFVRCHKSFIANIDNITKVEPSSNIIYFQNAFCDIGPKYKTDFIQQFNNSKVIT